MEPSTTDAYLADDGATPGFRAVDGFNPLSIRIPITREEGVTSAIASPDGELLYGTAAWFDLTGSLEDAPDPSFGRIAVGKRADLLLVEGDPSASIEAVSRIRDVFLAGQRLVRTPIDAASPL